MYITKGILLCTVCWYGELYHVSLLVTLHKQLNVIQSSGSTHCTGIQYVLSIRVLYVLCQLKTILRYIIYPALCITTTSILSN